MVALPLPKPLFDMALMLRLSTHTTSYRSGKKTKETTYLVPGTDFEIVNYSNDIKKGTASVTLRGLGSYGGTRVIKYTYQSPGTPRA